MTPETADSRLSVEPRRSAWANLLSLQGGQAAALLVGAVSVAVASRLLGPARYGALTLALAVAQYAVILTVSWTSASVVRFGREEFLATGGINKTFWTRLALVGPLLALAMAVLLLGRAPIAATIGQPLGPVAVVLALIAMLAMSDHLDGALQAIGVWRRFAWIGAVEKSVYVAGLGVLVWTQSVPSVALTLTILVAAIAVRNLSGFAGVLRARAVRAPAIDVTTALAIVRYSWPYTLTFTIGYFSNFVEPFLIKKYLTVSDVGIYQAAFQVSLVAAALLAPLSTLLFPSVTSLRLQQREDVLRTLLVRLFPQILFAINILVVIGMAVTAVMFPLVFGPEYASGLPPLLILLAVISFQSVAALFSPLLAAYDLTKQYAALNVIGGLGAHLLPQLLLIPIWGTSGAAASWFVWYVCSAGTCVWLVSRRIGLPSYSALSYSAISLVGLMIVWLLPAGWVQWLLIVALVVAAWWWARRRRLFQMSDLLLLEALGVPASVRQVVAKAYACF